MQVALEGGPERGDVVGGRQLLGGLLLAAVDTEGKPSVSYRARRAAKRAAHTTEKNYGKAQKRAAKAQRRSEKRIKKAHK